MGRTSDANERLMDAALDLIWEESYGAITIDDICKRAGVAKGSFYYFFSSKSELAVAALERMWQEVSKPKMDGIFSPSVEPLTRIRNYLASMYDFQAEIKQKHGKVLGCPVMSVGSETCTCDEEAAVGNKIRELFARKRRYYESAIRDALAEGSIEPGDPSEKATAVAGLIEGILTQARILNNPEVLRALPDLAMRILGAKTAVQPATIKV
ncbi:TetR/AcrR family transcriptional regulator [Opitutus sp. GAS368]|jgi:TetR/AcrR family transcriptional repressor of nem operon|uniref:TetR/AcrR family transcriptional regulator n=1 Tax=Opitutus sp. GAS368 TaxID=1882749 RepID=UPI00087A0AC1|nr:TetR/AcrR family transcriptional regulator [Opitutus sp. GAS368]SDS10205.1 transcriptional regulator, TetR family [Opitutus sp. GAS368]